MVELCGARPVGGTIDVGGRRAPPRARAPARARGRGAARRRRPARRAARDPRAPRLRRRATPTTGSTSPCRTGAAATSRARPTSSRRSGASGASTSCRSRCPRAAAPAGGSSPRSGCAGARRTRWSARGLYEILGWSFAAPDARSTGCALPADDPRRRVVALENPMSEDQSVMRTTLLGSLLDNAAPQPRARASTTCGCGRPARSTSRAASAADGRVRASRPPASARPDAPGPALPEERMHLGALLTGRVRPPTWGEPEPPRAGLLRRQGRARGACSARCACRGASSPTREPFLHPGRAARVLVGGERGGLARRAAPVGRRARGTSSGVAGFELDLGVVLAPPRRSCRDYEDLTSFPAVRQDLAVVVRRRRRPRRACSRSCARRAARCCAGPRSSTSTAARRSARAARSLALRLEFRAPDRTLTDEEVAQRRAKIVAALRRAPRGRAAWLASPSSARRGYAGAIAARLLAPPPDFELAHVTARSDAGARLDDVHPRTRVPLELEASTPSATATSTPRSSPTRTARPRPVVAELRERGVRVVDLSADFRLHDRGDLRGLVRRARRARAARQAVYGLPELHRDADRAAPTSSPTPAATRPRRCSRSPRSPAPACSATW